MLTESLEKELTDHEENDHYKEILEGKITALESALDDLLEEQQRMIKLFYLEKKSYQEISDELKLPLKKVKSALQNGKRNLKLKLENHDSFKSA